MGTSWFFFHLVFVVCAWLLSPSVTDCCCLWPTNNMDFANLCYFCYLWSVVTFESNKQIMWIRWSCPTPLLLALTLHLRAPPFPKSLHTFQQTASKLTAPRKPFFKAMTHKNLRLSGKIAFSLSFHSFDNIHCIRQR